MKSNLFGDWLKRERLARGLTQGDLEDRASLGYAYVSKVERGRTKIPSEEVRQRIHKVLNTTDDDLVREGILVRLDTPGFDPVYIPSSESSRARRAVEETEARYDAIDPRHRLRLRADTLTSEQAQVILAMLDVFAPES